MIGKRVKAWDEDIYIGSGHIFHKREMCVFIYIDDEDKERDPNMEGRIVEVFWDQWCELWLAVSSLETEHYCEDVQSAFKNYFNQ